PLLAPAEAVVRLRELLEEYVPALAPEEREGAAVAFGQAIAAAARAAPGEPGALALLRRGCALFPESARLAGELAEARRRAGEQDEANQHHARALALRRLASLYRDEVPQEDGTVLYWQFAEHIRKWSGDSSP